MGFTGKVAAKFKEDYINAFNSMERALKEDAAPKKALYAAQNQLQIEQQQTAFWKQQANFWSNSYDKSTELMCMMSKNELRLAEMMVEYRDENIRIKNVLSHQLIK